MMGVARDATDAQIKQAYRKLARKYHPDVSKEKNAEARFKEVGEAYEVLKSPEKRAAYDQLGKDYRPGRTSGRLRIGTRALNSAARAQAQAMHPTAIFLTRCSARRRGPGAGAAAPLIPDTARIITPRCCWICRRP